MNKYVSPVIFDNDELAEGVYATGSGADPDCWNITVNKIEKNSTTDNPGYNKSSYEVVGTHKCVQHISLATTMEFSLMPGAVDEKIDYVEVENTKAFPDGTTAYSESDHLYDDHTGADLGPRFEITATQHSLTIKRKCHANAYAFAAVTDTFTINVMIYCTHGTYTFAYLSHECDKHENVQGGGGDGT